jgi:hypothetical protein
MSAQLQLVQDSSGRSTYGLRVSVQNLTYRVLPNLLAAYLVVGLQGGAQAATLESAHPLLQQIPVSAGGHGVVQGRPSSLFNCPLAQGLAGVVELLSAVAQEREPVARECPAEERKGGEQDVALGPYKLGDLVHDFSIVLFCSVAGFLTSYIPSPAERRRAKGGAA